MSQLTNKYTFNASKEAIYHALTDSKEFTNFSGANAEIDAKPGGFASLFTGYIQGYFIEMKQNERLIMAWKDCYNWSDGEYSILTISLESNGDETTLTWHQEGVPEREVDHLSKGVGRKYITPLQNYLATGVALTAPTPDTCQIAD